MASWNKLKQVTRETFGNKDQKTEIPGDIKSLLNKSENVEKLLLNTIDNAIECFPERKIKTKSADDPVKEQPMYALGQSLLELAAEYQTDHDTKNYMMASSKSLILIAGYKSELDTKVLGSFVEPKRDLVATKVKQAEVHYETLKEKRLELDTKKHKLKMEKKTGESGKMRKYEVEVDLAQEKFDMEASAIRELLAPVANEKEQGIEQVQQTVEMISHMKEYFLRAYQALEELEKQTPMSTPTTRMLSPTASLMQSPYANQSTPRRMHSPHSPISNPALSPKPPVTLKPFKPSSSTPNLPTMTSPKPSPPAIPIKPRIATTMRCAALYDFEKEQEGDLDFVTGDLIQVTKSEGEWWEGKNIRTGQTGNFPCNYVKKL